MQVQPIDLTAIVAIIMGMMTVLIPIAGFTARFAIKPITEAIAKMRDGSTDRQVVELLERRLSLLEQEVHTLDGVREQMARLAEELDFQRQLQAPKSQS